MEKCLSLESRLSALRSEIESAPMPTAERTNSHALPHREQHTAFGQHREQHIAYDAELEELEKKLMMLDSSMQRDSSSTGTNASELRGGDHFLPSALMVSSSASGSMRFAQEIEDLKSELALMQDHYSDRVRPLSNLFEAEESPPVSSPPFQHSQRHYPQLADLLNSPNSSTSSFEVPRLTNFHLRSAMSSDSELRQQLLVASVREEQLLQAMREKDLQLQQCKDEVALMEAKLREEQARNVELATMCEQLQQHAVTVRTQRIEEENAGQSAAARLRSELRLARLENEELCEELKETRRELRVCREQAVEGELEMEQLRTNLRKLESQTLMK